MATKKKTKNQKKTDYIYIRVEFRRAQQQKNQTKNHTNQLAVHWLYRICCVIFRGYLYFFILLHCLFFKFSLSLHSIYLQLHLFE